MKLFAFAFALIFAATLFGQDINTKSGMLRPASAQAIGISPFNVPAGIDGLELVTVPQVNEQGGAVFARVSNSGDYYLYAQMCGDQSVHELGNFNAWVQPGQTMVTPVFDLKKHTESIPHYGQVCAVAIVQIAPGKLGRVGVNFNPDRNFDKLEVIGEAVLDDYYVITVANLNPKVSVVIGQEMKGEIRRDFSGRMQVWFKEGYLPGSGPTTITGCYEGLCATSVYERKVQYINFGKGGGKG